MTEEKPPSWWVTLPGMVTAAAALLTAVTGLLLGLGQLGVFNAAKAPIVSGQATGAASPRTGTSTHSGASDRPGETASSPGNTAPGEGPGWTVTLPEQRKYRSSEVEYEVLSAEARPDVDGKITLTFSVRATNHGRYDLNFWDSTFRLNVAGVSVAPDSGLNELVSGDSSKSGDVSFTVPAETREAALRIKFLQGESTVSVRVASP
ncbi:hypothetical protein [Arthrobacter sp. SAFR-014]|uniref:hypothetical protein n=1 Tax=unclassified Arthrobacter TaxID=235627 RepID=UPI003F7BA26B